MCRHENKKWSKYLLVVVCDAVWQFLSSPLSLTKIFCYVQPLRLEQKSTRYRCQIEKLKNKKVKKMTKKSQADVGFFLSLTK